jgi:tRNA pseudouridine55 synthase
VVQLVRRRLGQRRVGHAGTLDPAATGVLPICLGRATRFADLVGAGSKVYLADVVLGVATDTWDADGRVSQQAEPSAVAAPRRPTLAEACAALERLLGPLMQVPPTYSAVKVGGEAAYARARRGEAVTLETRPVRVYGLAVLDWQLPRLAIAVHCSRGTYVRALARDLGEALGTAAHLDALVRLAVGSFTIADAVTIEAFEAAAAVGQAAALVEPPDRASLRLPVVILGQQSAAFFGHGRAWSDPAGAPARDARAYAADGLFLGLVRAGGGSLWQPSVSFVYDPVAKREHGAPGLVATESPGGLGAGGGA